MGQLHAKEKHGDRHQNAAEEGCAHAQCHRLLGPVGLFCAHILSGKGRKGLRERRGHQHNKGTEFFCHAYTCGRREAKAVDDGKDHQEGDAYQQFLQGDGRAQADHVPQDGAIPTDEGAFKGKRQTAPADDPQANQHTDALGKDRGKRSTGGAHMEHANQQQIADHIGHTGNGHRQQRGFGVAHSAEHTSQQVIGHDKQAAGAANADISRRFAKGLHGSMHQGRQAFGRHHLKHRHQQTHQCKQANGCADDFTGLLLTPLADALGNQHGDAHGKAGDHNGDGMQNLTAGGNSGHIGRGAEPAHHQQVYRTISCLQAQSQKHRARKAQQRGQDGAAEEVFLLSHKGTLLDTQNKSGRSRPDLRIL